MAEPSGFLPTNRDIEEIKKLLREDVNSFVARVAPEPARIMRIPSPQGEKIAKEEPQPVDTVVKVTFDSLQNRVFWDNDNKVIHLQYVPGFIPAFANSTDPNDDGTYTIPMHPEAVKFIKSKEKPLLLRNIRKGNQDITSYSIDSYANYDIGYNICKWYVAPAPEGFEDKVKELIKKGLLPEDYQFGNAPFSEGMCLNPIVNTHRGTIITACNEVPNQNLCTVYEPEDGVKVKIKTQLDGELDGRLVRTYNPMKGSVQKEIFSNKGRRFTTDIDHSILEEETSDQQDRNPLLQNVSS